MSDLLELAARCEAAAGPNRELNIAMLPLVGLRFVDEGHPIGQVCYDSNNHAVPMPSFTASLDAAMTLVPEGMYPNIDCEPSTPEVEIYAVDNPHGAKGISYKAATPALALCAAALRARAGATT